MKIALRWLKRQLLTKKPFMEEPSRKNLFRFFFFKYLFSTITIRFFFKWHFGDITKKKKKKRISCFWKNKQIWYFYVPSTKGKSPGLFRNQLSDPGWELMKSTNQNTSNWLCFGLEWQVYKQKYLHLVRLWFRQNNTQLIKFWVNCQF